MKYSNLTRCDNPNLTYFENIYICQIVTEFMKKEQNILKIFLLNAVIIYLFVTIVSNFVCTNVIYNFSKYVEFRK